MDLTALTIGGVVLVPFITGLVQVAKGIGLQDKYCPVVALILGAILGAVYTVVTGDAQLIAGIVTGIASGLASSGLYDIKHEITKSNRK